MAAQAEISAYVSLSLFYSRGFSCREKPATGALAIALYLRINLKNEDYFMSKILIVDDEPNIRDIIREYLEFENFSCKEAANGSEALAFLKEESFDVIILDIMMPKIDGITVLKELRKTTNTPVIMLSARGDEYDKLFCFEMGADDYVVKPFSPKELLARVKNMLRRCGNHTPEPERLVCGELCIDVSGRNVFIGGQKVNVTPKEFDLLLFLCRNRNVALSRDKILSEVWGYDFYGDDRTVDTHVKMLRNNLGSCRGCIKTVWGFGYKFELDD